MYASSSFVCRLLVVRDIHPTASQEAVGCFCFPSCLPFRALPEERETVNKQATRSHYYPEKGLPMTDDSRQRLLSLFKSRAVSFGAFTLASGKQSTYYINSKKALFHSEA